MTDFTIPEEAVEAGLRAVNTSIHCLSDRGKVHVAIAAALPVMFERAGYLQGVGFYLKQHDESYVPVYRIKEPK